MYACRPSPIERKKMAFQYTGILSGIAEASDIQRELGVSSDEAWAIQRQRADERLREYEAQKAEEQPSNVVHVDFSKGRK